MSNDTEREADESMLRGQARLWQHLYGHMDGVAIRCAVELRIADILSTHGHPMSLSRLAQSIDLPTLNMDGLSRLMRFLVHRKVFDSSTHQPGEEDEGEQLYSLNDYSKWLVRDANLTMAPFVMTVTDPVAVLPLYALDKAIEQGVSTYKATYGEDAWDVNARNPEFNRTFNEGMACCARIITSAVVSNYESGFREMKGTLVDVAGGTGSTISEIVKAYSHLKGINFDLPHVIATAPSYDGVTHVGGDMFNTIPRADSIYLQWALHNWSDDDCVKILKNCRKAVPENTGRVIIVDVVMNRGGDGLFDETGFVFDLIMLAAFFGGKERTEVEWKRILEDSGFPRYKIIKIPALQSIIVAYP